MLKRLLSLLIISSGLVLNANATHIVGGEINYEHLKGDSFKIQLDLYIDCINGSPEALLIDTIANIALFYADTRNIYKDFDVKRSSPTRIKNVNYNCLIPPSNVCVDKYSYIFTTTIPDYKAGYVITYQRCCRNTTIINVFDQDNTGATFWTTIPPRSQIGNNSSPKFKSLPPNFLCLDRDFTFNHSAVDKDNDSLYYELTLPYAGADDVQPVPRPPAKPPYARIVLKSGYSSTYQIDGNPTLSINPQTGVLNLKPTRIGQFAVGISVKEYRNGILLSTTIRDFQFNVIRCQFDVVSSFALPYQQCDETVEFSNKSSGASSYTWYFGDKNNSSSKLKEPTFKYSGPGVYTAMLVATSSSCSDTFYKEFEVRLDTGTFAGSDKRLCPNESTMLGKSSIYDPEIKYQWSPKSFLSSDTVSNPVSNPISSITYQLRKTFDYCYIDDTVDIKVGNPIADFSHIYLKECGGLTVDFKNTSIDGTSYKWYFGTGDLSDTSTNKNPKFTYPGKGNYRVTLETILNGKCSDTKTQIIEVNPDTTKIAGEDKEICIGDTVQIGNPLNVNSTGTFKWTPSTNIINDEAPLPKVYPNTTTDYIVAKKLPFCTVYDTVSVNVDRAEPFFQLAYTAPCDGLSIKVYNQSKNAINSIWDFGDGSPTTASNLDSIAYSYNSNGDYTIVLTGTTQKGCSESYSMPLNIMEDTTFFAGLDSNLCFGDSLILGKNDTTSFAKFRWVPALLVSDSTLPNPVIKPELAQQYILYKQYPECTFIDTVNIGVFNPQPKFLLDYEPHCDVTDVSIINQSTGYDSLFWQLKNESNQDIKFNKDSLFTFKNVNIGSNNLLLIAYQEHCSESQSVDFEVYIDTGAVAGADTVVCINDSIQIGQIDTVINVEHFWTPPKFLDNDRVSNPFSKPTMTVTYIYERRFESCSYFDTITLRIAEPIAEFDSSFSIVCEGYEVQLANESKNAAAYQWTLSDGSITNDENTFDFVPFGGSFDIKLKAIDEHCFNEKSITHTVPIFNSIKIDAGNVFSPNGDGINDCFKISIPQLPDDCTDFILTIYNRWGQVVYNKEPEDAYSCWNGRNQENNVNVAPGVYYYLLNMRGQKKFGTITLLR